MQRVVTGCPYESGLSCQRLKHVTTIALYGRIRQKDVYLSLRSFETFQDFAESSFLEIVIDARETPQGTNVGLHPERSG